MNVERLTYPNAARAAEACAERIRTGLQEALHTRPFATLAISGGSSPKKIFEALAASSMDWSRVHLFWVDERMVPPGDPQSNFTMAERSLIEPARIPATNVHRVRGELTPEEAARLYAGEIRSVFALGNADLPRFDAIHCGIGADGHTASLFPGEPLIDDRSNLAAAVHVEKLAAAWRVTLLPGVLLAARSTVVYATGADKAVTIGAIFQDPFNPMRLPAQLLTHSPSAVAWFMDEASASRLH